MKNEDNRIIQDLQKPRTKLLMVLSIFTLILIVVNLVFVNINSAEDQIYIQKTSDLRVLSQEIAKNASEVISGSEEAFDNLQQSKVEFQTAWKLINDGEAKYVDSSIGLLTSLPAKGDTINSIQPKIFSLWLKVRNNTDLVLENQEAITNLNVIASSIAESIPKIQRNYDEVVNNLLDNDASLSTIAVAQRQAWLSERIALNLNRIVSGDDQAEVGVEQLQRDVNLFFSNHESLLEGDASIGINRVRDSGARAYLDEVTELFSVINEQTRTILGTVPEIIKATEAIDSIIIDSESLLFESTALSQYFTDSRGNHIASPMVGYGLLLSIFILMLFYGLEVIRQSHKAEKIAGEENEKKNNAVLSLLEEISDLADGDLTVEATVSEDFTGAIADSINYAIAQLRELVSAITEVTVEVTSSTKSSAQKVQYLSNASERQAASITSVSKSVQDMERSINEVTNNAQKSLGVAKNSVEIASGGAEVVKSTIQGMDTIREQIQESAKRIKRLGESSQEIGGFVSLINDIADHTNTLSLNAAIQAAMAGDAGKGFGVVADEVHALAIRSTDATRQIEALVKVIQRDINEAVFSMEQTTADVVEGTRLAQGAGVALDDIENVSKELAELVANISKASTGQSKTASEITHSMGAIQKVTTETSSGTKATSQFMTNLTILTERLDGAVSGFSLSQKKMSAPSKQEGEKDAPIRNVIPNEINTYVAKENKKAAKIATV